MSYKFQLSLSGYRYKWLLFFLISSKPPLFLNVPSIVSSASFERSASQMTILSGRKLFRSQCYIKIKWFTEKFSTLSFISKHVFVFPNILFCFWVTFFLSKSTFEFLRPISCNLLKHFLELLYLFDCDISQSIWEFIHNIYTIHDGRGQKTFKRDLE